MRHPCPYGNESFFGYILRLSETNGYLSPSSLLHLGQMKPCERQPAGVRVENSLKLQAVQSRNSRHVRHTFKPGENGVPACYRTEYCQLIWR